MAANNNNKNLNVPSLRFPGFTDEWHTAILEDIANLSKGSGISKDKLSVDGKPCILYGELYTKYTSEIISEIFSRTNTTEKNLVQSEANDVIIPASGETAIDISTARCISKSGVLLGGDLNIIRFENQNGSFFSYQLNGVRKLDIARIAQGVSVVHLYGDKLRKLRVFFPSLMEQKKIADFLSLLDERIATQRSIIKALESLIEGVRRTIYVEIMREVGLNSTFGEVLQYEQPTKYLVENTEYSDDTSLIPVLTANKAFVLGYTNAEFGVYSKGHCIILDDFTLDCKYVNFPFKVKSSAIKILTSKDKSLLRYIYEYFKFIAIKTTEHQRHYISQIEPMGLPICDNEKIEKVAALFISLDKQLAHANRIIDLYTQQRQYFLSKMFI